VWEVTEKKAVAWGSSEDIGLMISCLARQVELVGKARDTLVRDPDSLWAVVVILLCSVHDTAKSALLLARAGQMRDCMMLARSVFETGLNAAFICAEGATVASRAQRHALQKSYRRTLSQLRFHARFRDADLAKDVDLPVPRAVVAALKEYTGRKGREITAWTPEPVAKRISAVSQRYGAEVGKIFEVVHAGTYADSSELMHGTLYGAMMALGQTKLLERVITPKQLRAHFGEHICMLLHLISGVLCTLICVVDKERGIPEIRRESVQSLTEAGEAAGFPRSLSGSAHPSRASEGGEDTGGLSGPRGG
jgi:hypothetical protein